MVICSWLTFDTSPSSPRPVCSQQTSREPNLSFNTHGGRRIKDALHSLNLVTELSLPVSPNLAKSALSL